jgi:hypothetical protein
MFSQNFKLMAAYDQQFVRLMTLAERYFGEIQDETRIRGGGALRF